MRNLTFFLVWNVLLAGILPSRAYSLSTARHKLHKEKLQRFKNNSEGYTMMTKYPQNQNSINYYNHNRFNQKPDSKIFAPEKQKNRCNGKEKLLDDIGALAIVSGGVGTVMGIFSAAYFSVIGNVVSIIATIVGFATAIPSAIITYLATTDRLTYAVANFLSVLGLANTFYGQWSVDLGNKDIVLSSIGNAVGVFSLVLSIVSGFEEVFDSVLEGCRQLFGRRVVDEFVNGYRCDGSDFWGDMVHSFKDLGLTDLL